MKFIIRAAYILLFTSIGILGFAQINLSQKLPVDPNIKMGKLANGLTYYIQQNKKPERTSTFYGAYELQWFQKLP